MKIINGDAGMRILGEQLGSRLRGGEIIELIGDVGAGKTTLVKGIGRGLKIDEDIQSPSFTVSRVYPARDHLTLAHYDFYRLNDAGIMADELAEAVTDSNTIVVIEWGDIIGGVLPGDYIRLSINPVDEVTRALELAIPKSYSYLEHVFA